MNNHVSTPSAPVPNHASTSTNPHAVTPASYHPAPRPNPLSFHRIDTHQIKQQLHDALGEAGLPYWKALNGYLLGQVGRDELQALVRSWLSGKTLQLHNQLLNGLLYNASSPQLSNAPSSSSMHKRRRGGIDAPDFDSDATFIEPKDRVQHWVMGMGGRERERVRRGALLAAEEEEEEAEKEVELHEWVGGRKRKWSAYASTDLVNPPLAQGARYIPSSNQLALRLSQVAKSWGLDVLPDSSREVGEFMGVGLNAHLGDILHSVVHLTGRERPGEDTLHVPPGVHPEANGDDSVSAHPIPPPTLKTLQYLFTLAPGLHPQASPTLYKLASSLTLAEVENTSPPASAEERAATTAPALGSTPAQPTVALPSHPTPQSGAATVAQSPVKAAAVLHNAVKQGALESVSQTLVETGLLKIDKAGRGEGEEEGRKREKKHNLHWKYEDPALILKDLLG